MHETGFGTLQVVILTNISLSFVCASRWYDRSLSTGRDVSKFCEESGDFQLRVGFHKGLPCECDIQSNLIVAYLSREICFTKVVQTWPCQIPSLITWFLNTHLSQFSSQFLIKSLLLVSEFLLTTISDSMIFS